jgi:hypothetical protein
MASAEQIKANRLNAQIRIDPITAKTAIVTSLRKARGTASARQLRANRQNAQHSTGPKSEAGKRRASENALTHGLTAKRVLLPGEDAELLEALWYEALAYFAPVGFEILIVRDWFETMWRLRRIPAWETAMFHSQFREVNTWSEFRGYEGGDTQLEDRRMAYVISRVLNCGHFPKLQRYDAALHRRFVATTKLLLELRKARGAPPLPAVPPAGKA